MEQVVNCCRVTSSLWDIYITLVLGKQGFIDLFTDTIIRHFKKFKTTAH